MRGRGRIEIVTRKCPRCGKQTAGVSRSITGADAAHAEFAGLCEACATAAEKQEILNAQAGAILGYDFTDPNDNPYLLDSDELERTAKARREGGK